MSDTLYIQIDKNLKVTSPKVRLDAIAQLYCKNRQILDKCKHLYVYEIPNGAPGRYVVSAVDLIEEIQSQCMDLEVTHIGEPVFILTYEDSKEKSQLWGYIKVAIISVITFFGAGLSIMTFNVDVDITTLFSDLYYQVTGQVSDGFTELELMYSIGIGIGVIFFFNHFGRKKLTEDPTPIQVQMRIYEDNIDTTVIEHMNRSQESES